MTRTLFGFKVTSRGRSHSAVHGVDVTIMFCVLHCGVNRRIIIVRVENGDFGCVTEVGECDKSFWDGKLCQVNDKALDSFRMISTCRRINHSIAMADCIDRARMHCVPASFIGQPSRRVTTYGY